jgi:hypothetical protein
MFCNGHGGGKRCQFPEGCVKSAIVSTMFCVAHGGGKRIARDVRQVDRQSHILQN